MVRLLFRLILIAYFVMPLAAGGLVVGTFVQVRSDVAPVVDAATASISRATTALDNELSDLGSHFQPLVNAVNAIQRALQTVINFLRDTVYTLIDVVNGLNLACSVGRAACIPKSLNVTLPRVIDLSFIDNIAAEISNITTPLNQAITVTTSTLTSYASIIVLAVAVFMVWMALTWVLFVVMLYRGLWKLA